MDGPVIKFREMACPTEFTGKYEPSLKFERPRFSVPTPGQMPSIQRAVTFGGPNGYQTEERRTELNDFDESRHINYLSPDTNWYKYNPDLKPRLEKLQDINLMDYRKEFVRHRWLKDINGEKVPRVSNIVSYKDCSCSLPIFNVYGCERDGSLYTQHVTYSNMNKFPTPYHKGYFGYRQEQLDRHNTGFFWNSRYHS